MYEQAGAHLLLLLLLLLLVRGNLLCCWRRAVPSCSSSLSLGLGHGLSLEQLLLVQCGRHALGVGLTVLLSVGHWHRERVGMESWRGESETMQRWSSTVLVLSLGRTALTG